MQKGPSDGWFQRFMSRHPDLSSRKPENLDKGRMSMSNYKVVGDYFEFLDGILGKYGIKNKPSQIFNCDETGFTGKEMPRAKVFGPKGKHVFRQKISSSDHITAHLCVSANGRFLPSMIIFQVNN
ncbi:uncharacterized protein LOC132731679 [Ruditapes philippinarum]|uniref:uncharacterized protein LOC132731679 n=1 Tax=Ruditapes philippinarum TaxID=129788 RepID=UPI00295B04C9|nr:uncharacterized protein LOC132731679 [Ruditapes philippinarum]